VTEFLEHPVAFAKYILVYLGRAFGFDTPTGGVAGIALVVAFVAAAAVVVARRRDAALLDRTAIWLGLGTYCLGSALMTGLSRLGFGPQQAAASRYTTTALLFGIATMALVFAVAMESRLAGRPVTTMLRFRLSYAVALPLLVMGVANTVNGSDQFADYGGKLDRIATCVRQVTGPDDPCLKQPESGYEPEQSTGIAYLRKVGWGGF
jgi:hypothetical protein